MKSFQEFVSIHEMATAADDVKAKIYVDDEDRDFVQQATKTPDGEDTGVSQGSAIRFRYKDLLQLKPNDGDVLHFQGNNRGKIPVKIERMHLKHLQDKLRAAGFVRGAEEGIDFNRQDSLNFFQPKFNKKGEPETPYVHVNKMKKSEEMQSFDYHWSEEANFSNDLDFSDVLEAVKSLVGRNIKPEVWEKFNQDQKHNLTAVLTGVKAGLKITDPTYLEAPQGLKRVLANVMARTLISGNVEQKDRPGKMAVESGSWLNFMSKKYTLQLAREWWNIKEVNPEVQMGMGGEDGEPYGAEVVAKQAPDDDHDSLDSTMGPAPKLLTQLNRSDAQGKTRGRRSQADIQAEKELEAVMAPLTPIIQKLAQRVPLTPEELQTRQRFLDDAAQGVIPPNLTRDVVDSMRVEPVAQPQPKKKFTDDEFDYQKFISTPDDEGPDVGAYSRPGARSFGHRLEHAGATCVAGNPKPGKDYQIEGDPAGSARSMRKPFKKYVQERDSARKK